MISKYYLLAIQLKKYHKICAAITKDKVLNTTNLILLQGYGYETD